MTRAEILLGLVVHAYNPSNGEAEAEDLNLKASQGCIVRPCLQKAVGVAQAVEHLLAGMKP
jgi:hypothetical protein